MTLDQLLKKVDWLEINPSPQGFVDLRIAVREYGSQMEEASQLLSLLNEEARPEGRVMKSEPIITGLTLPKSSGR